MKNLFLYILVVFTSLYSFCDSLSHDQFLLKKAQNYRLENKLNFATEILQKLYIESSDYKKEAFNELLSIYNSQQKWTESITLIKNDLNTQPFNLDLRNQLLNIYKNQNNYTAVISELIAIEKIKGADVKLLTEKYRTYMSLLDYSSALDNINLILNKEPQNYSVSYDKALVLFELKKYKEAYSHIRKIYTDDYINEDVLSFYSKISYQIHYLGEFSSVAKKCVTLFPKNALCNEYLGKYHFEKNNYKQAFAYFKNSYENKSQSKDILFSLARTATKLNSKDDIHFYYQKCLSDQPQHEDCLKEWVSTLKNQNENVLLSQVLEKFIQNNKNHIWSTVEYSKLLHYIDENQLALSHIEKISHFYPDNDDLKIYLSFFLFKNNKIQEAKNVILEIKSSHIDKDQYLDLIEPKNDKLFLNQRSLSSIPLNVETPKNKSWELPTL